MEEGQTNAATYRRASLGIRNCYANCLVFRPNASLLIEQGTDADNYLDQWPQFTDNNISSFLKVTTSLLALVQRWH